MTAVLKHLFQTFSIPLSHQQGTAGKGFERPHVDLAAVGLVEDDFRPAIEPGHLFWVAGPPVVVHAESTGEPSQQFTSLSCAPTNSGQVIDWFLSYVSPMHFRVTGKRQPEDVRVRLPDQVRVFAVGNEEVIE